ncbi:MAG: hypothetical protein R2792_10135 [Saprospiraceae bacterium]
MSGLKEFLQRRSENLQKERNQNSENENLSDDEFWAIMNAFGQQSKELAEDENPVDLLEKILEPLPLQKVIQFAEKFEKLNS